MGKLKDNYNKIKPTLRQNKQNKKNEKDKIEINKMCEFLKQKWKNNDIKYNCGYCLKEAYNSEINESQGYVTDEDLIQSSNNKLKHK